ncbi:MAG: alternative ribosome rescue aminoacyl-tRNA hydrolase ArfB [Nitrospirota bacterium]|nr:alternative ribosome rescue aminoacyl-tRNA hydrolase ArfB [Nitrospirota bacterium]
MLRVGHGVVIPMTEIGVSFARSPGPGGQNVNKVETAVVLRFDAAHSPSLPDPVRQRLLKMAGHLATAAGEILIHAHRHRTRERNRQDALERLRALIERAAAPPPPPRKKTKPGRAARERRLTQKGRRGTVKRLRGPVGGDD